MGAQKVAFLNVRSPPTVRVSPHLDYLFRALCCARAALRAALLEFNTRSCFFADAGVKRMAAHDGRAVHVSAQPAVLTPIDSDA